MLAWFGISLLVMSSVLLAKMYAQLDKLGLISKHEKAASEFNDISQNIRIFDESIILHFGRFLGETCV